MQNRFIRYSMIVLLIGPVALGAGRADGRYGEWAEVFSPSWGIAPGQTVRTSVVWAPGFVGGVMVARVQLLDTEGEVVAQSDEIRVEPGKTRFWEVPYEQIGGAREPRTGRLQLRTRILFEKGAFDRYNPFVTVDFIESIPGTTSGPSLFLPLAAGKHIDRD